MYKPSHMEKDLLLFYSAGEKEAGVSSVSGCMEAKEAPHLSKQNSAAPKTENHRLPPTQSEAGVAYGVSRPPSLSCLHFILMDFILTESLLKGKQNSNSCRQTNSKPPGSQPLGPCSGRCWEQHLIDVGCSICCSFNRSMWF